MHFIDSLFTVLDSDVNTDGGRFSLRLDAKHPIYRGHFPDNPITPGVCSLEIIMQLIAANYQDLKRPTQVDSIKFLGFVNPLQTPEVGVEFKVSSTGEGIWRVRGMLSAGQKPAVKVVLSYQNIAQDIKLKYHD